MSNQLVTYAAHAIQLYQGKTDTLDFKILASKAFVDFCQEHRILSRMEKMLLPYFIPGSEREYLVSRLTEDRTRALKQIAAFNIIAKAFNKNNITWLSFKGPVLSQALFGDATIRSSKDIDIWVPKTELKKSHDILINNNFLLKSTSEKEKCKIWHTILHKDDIYLHQATGVELELHWHLIPGSRFTDNLIINNRQIITFFQNRTPVFNPEMEFIYLCAHAGKSHWQRLSWLFDIYDYSLKISPNKEKLFFTAKQYHLDFYLDNSLCVINYFFKNASYNSTETHWIIEKIGKKSIERILTGYSLLGKRSIFIKTQELLQEAILSKNIKNLAINICITFLNKTKKRLR